MLMSHLFVAEEINTALDVMSPLEHSSESFRASLSSTIPSFQNRVAESLAQCLLQADNIFPHLDTRVGRTLVQRSRSPLSACEKFRKHTQLGRSMKSMTLAMTTERRRNGLSINA
jgi:hypothetical protein